jgi:hypothetical protein
MGLLKKKWSSIRQNLRGKPPKLDFPTSGNLKVESQRRSFLDLPVELVEQITDNLSKIQDILALRLVCRDLLAKTWATFCETFVATLETDLSTEDMQQIRILASQDKLRGYVKTLSISAREWTPQFPSDKNALEMEWTASEQKSVFGRGHQWPRSDTGYLEGNIPLIADLGNLLATRFVNCKSFRVHDAENDYPQTPYSKDFITSADTVSILLRIIATYKIEVIFFEINFGWGRSLAHLDPMRINTNQWAFEPSQAAWNRSLEALHLTFPRFSSEHHPLAIELITAAKSLRSLKLGIDMSHNQDHFLRSLAQNRFSAPLKELVLFTVHTSEEALVGFLQSCSGTLSSITLCQARLSEGSWRSILRILRDGVKSEKYPAMESVTLFNLMGPHDLNHSDTRIYFGELHKNPFLPNSDERIEMVERSAYGAVRTVAARYKGSYIEVALDKLAKSVYPLRLDPVIMSRPWAVEDMDTMEPLLKDFSIDEYRW